MTGRIEVLALACHLVEVQVGPYDADLIPHRFDNPSAVRPGDAGPAVVESLTIGQLVPEGKVLGEVIGAVGGAHADHEHASFLGNESGDVLGEPD